MTKWTLHPKYLAGRDRLVTYLHTPTYRFRRAEPVVFLCGGAGLPNRDRLKDYLKKHLPTVDVFYAERVWDVIAANYNRSALEMESELADLADIVVIIVESPGTFAELGAFSLVVALRKKLLPILDSKYRSDVSFISTGPLRWIDRESDFKPSIYVPLPRILEAVGELEERLKRIPRAKPVRISDLATSPKHLLFFLCDLVAVIYPATIAVLEDYLLRIVPSISSSKIEIPTLVGLAVAMNLLRETSIDTAEGRQTFYSPGRSRAVERPFHHRRFLDLPSQRAAHAGVLLALPEALKILDAVNRGHDR